jgi:hypothetical protein
MLKMMVDEKDSQRHREDVRLMKKESLRKAFYTGGNSTCRAHIRNHYDVYKMRCQKENIPENHHAIPRPLWKRMQADKKQVKLMTQTKLDVAVHLVNRPQTFTREGVLHAVAQFIACDDQVRLSPRVLQHNNTRE